MNEDFDGENDAADEASLETLRAEENAPDCIPSDSVSAEVGGVESSVVEESLEESSELELSEEASASDEESDETDAPGAESEDSAESVDSAPVDGAPMDVVGIVPLVEALLFASGEPIGVDRVVEVTMLDRAEIESAFALLEERYADGNAGVQVARVADKYQLRTRPQFARYIQALFASRPKRLSAAALETLSIIAYRQPIVKSDVERIRGVDVTPTLKTLIERNLVKILGHQATVGQPALYGTTEEFLKLFGLNTLSELPTLRELAELDRDPGETEVESDQDVQGVEVSGPVDAVPVPPESIGEHTPSVAH